MKKFFIFYLICLSLLLTGLFVQAQDLSNIIFPVKELGNCADQDECKLFCEQEANMSSCLTFAEKNSLLSKEEVLTARKMLSLGAKNGPGGCKGKKACEAYCADVSHIDQCATFAEKYGLASKEELQEMKLVSAALKKGAKMPNCKNKAECDIFCGQPENMEECLSFGEAAGIISASEIKEARMVLAAVQKGAKMPNCRGKAECDKYCQEDQHFEECLSFGEAAGLISTEELQMARKTGGKGPGGCKGKEACDKYCQDDQHLEECVDFGLQFGMMTSEEAADAKKMIKAGIKSGPGGCQGKKECEAYCNDFKNAVECLDFAEKAGMMTPEEAQKARKMAELGLTGGPGGCKSEEGCQKYCDAPQNRAECLDFAIKTGQMSGAEVEQTKKMMNMMDKGGPGGCKNQVECESYCNSEDHKNECLNFAAQSGLIAPQEAQRIQQRMQIMEQGGPGGCKTAEVCQAFCQDPANATVCKDFAGQSGGMMPKVPTKEEIDQMIKQQSGQGNIPTPTFPGPNMQIPQGVIPQVGAPGSGAGIQPGGPVPGMGTIPDGMGITGPPTPEQIQQIQQQMIQQQMGGGTGGIIPPAGF